MSNTIPKGFSNRRLGDLLTFANGKSIKPGGEGEYPVYGSNGIIGYSDKARYENRIIIGRVGAYCGSVALCRGKFFASDNTIVAQPKDSQADTAFYYYLLRNLNLNHWAGGAAQPLLTQIVLNQIDCRIPGMETQRKISSTLTAYDDLIENNNRRIQILEEMAQLIYREWFINLRFPGHEEVKMVDSSLGIIPEGWEVGNLNEIVELIREGTQPGEHLSNRRYLPIDCLPRKRIALSESKSWEEAQSSLQLFEAKDIIFGAMRPYFHKVITAPFMGVTRTTCFVLRPRSESLEAFALLTIFQDEAVGFANAHSQGATIPYAVWASSFSNMPVIIPSLEVLREFQDYISPTLEYIRMMFFKQGNLQQARDMLLPKLILGEIDVSELDIEITEEIS